MSLWCWCWPPVSYWSGGPSLLTSHWGDGAVLVLVGLWCWGHHRQAGTAGTIVMLVVLGAIIVVIMLGGEAVLVLAIIVMVVLVGL
ncbi:hypothetical protein SCLCIDRAFT_1219401, partial [Scleroderma citrinum Foug A]